MGCTLDNDWGLAQTGMISWKPIPQDTRLFGLAGDDAVEVQIDFAVDHAAYPFG